MIIAVLAALVAVIATNAWLQDRAGKRHSETDLAYRLELAGLVGRLDTLAKDHAAQLIEVQDAHRAEVAMLCQRIQAPEAAVIEHQQTHVPDENGYPLTDMETAEAQDARIAAIAEIERMEREGLKL